MGVDVLLDNSCIFQQSVKSRSLLPLSRGELFSVPTTCACLLLPYLDRHREPCRFLGMRNVNCRL